MRSTRSLFALLLLASVSGCYQGYQDPQSYQDLQGYQISYVPNAGNWNAAAVEHPQRVRFYYGYIVNVRYVPVEYANRWIVPRWQPTGRWITGAVEPFDAADDPNQRVLPQPNLSAIEYTVMLDNSTFPPDQFLQPDQRPAIVVVQNIRSTDRPLYKGERVAVRVIGNSGHVIAADDLPRYVGDGIDVERALSAGPMPLPLNRRPDPQPSGCPFGSSQALVILDQVPDVVCHPYYAPPMNVEG